MKNFKFDLDQKVTIWKRTPFEIEAETLEEAKQKAIEFHQGGNTESLSWAEIEGTEEILGIEENGGEPTEELFLDGQNFWNNGGLKSGDKVLHEGIVRTIYGVYSNTHVSLCLIDEDGYEYEDVEEDFQIPIDELTPSSETTKQEVLDYTIKELSDDNLIDELRNRGYQTELLFNLTDVDRQIEIMNEDIDEDDDDDAKSPIVLCDYEKENVLDAVFENVDYYIERINSDIQDKINEQS